MAIIDVTVIPIGTNGPSVSHYVVEIHKKLEQYKDRVKVQLTPMSTLIEGDLSDLLEIVQVIHEVPFQHGALRVATNIRIDDRRDKAVKMEDKVRTIEEKSKKQGER